MSEKRYWLKLDEHFFNQDYIVYLETQPNGHIYTNIWIKILLLCLKNDEKDAGFLRFKEKIPYNDNLLSKVLRIDIDNIRIALKYFVELEMIEILEDGTIYIEEVQKMIGRESDSAERVRLHRERKKTLHLKCLTNYKNIPKISDSDNNYRYGGNYYNVINRDSGKCVVCGLLENICVHHIIGYDINNKESYKTNSMITLCRKCHSNEHANPYSIIQKEILNLIGFNYDFYENIKNINSCVTPVTVTDNDNINIEVEVEKEVDIDACNVTKNVTNQNFDNPSFSKPELQILKALLNFYNQTTEGILRGYISIPYSDQLKIIALIRSGFTLEDFKQVVTKKFTEWKDDDKFISFFTFSTLFGDKFQNYLNQKVEIDVHAEADKTYQEERERLLNVKRK